MSMLFMGPDKQRALLATAFEQSGDGYLYYRNAWSGGIPVSAEERDLYLDALVFGSRGAFFEE